MLHHWKRTVLFEPLESRLLLADGPLVISELTAVNTDGLTDVDGDCSDWIEIHNPTQAAVDLTGWYLTDDPGDLTQWPFPATSLGADEYVVVFASGKNRRDPAELHTNFRLSGEGEYLALVQPDEVSRSHEYAPAYPPQVDDVSYGLGGVTRTSETLIAAGADANYHVPTPGEDVLAWTATGYDDSAWTDTLIVGGSGLLITEISSGDVRFVEIQNVSDRTIDTSGWSVLVNDASSEEINQVAGVAWSLPDSVAPQEVLYRTDDADDHYWGSQIPWAAEGPGWVMIINDGGNVMDFVAWGYGAAEIASLDVSYGGFAHLAVGDQWSGAGAEPGTEDPGGGPGEPAFGAFNDHVAGAGTHPNATSYATNGISSGLLKDVTAGTDTGVTLTTSQSGVSYENTQGAPAAGTDAGDIFDGFVDFTSGTGASLAISGADHYTHTFTGLDTGDALTYKFAGTAVRGGDGYANRWTLVTLQGADLATPAHSAGLGVVVVSPTQVAIWTGENHRADQGFVSAWTEIDPGSDGEFSIQSMQYTGSTPGVGTGTANGSKGYAVTGLRLEEVGPSGPLSWLKRTGYLDGNTADDFRRTTQPSKGQQNADLTVPFGTLLPVTTGIGFSDNQSEFERIVATDVAEAMRGVNASLWTRIEFQVPDPSPFNELTLRMKYDDGFVAYLNGDEVARRSAPDPLFYDSAATAAHPNAEALAFEDIDVSAHLAGSLHAGTNVLAIHGLNAGAADADFLILPELVAGSVEQTECYLFAATPGGPNGHGFVDFVADTKFSLDRGFYTSPQQVVISTDTPGTTIRYTLDGSQPTAGSGLRYTAPLTISRTTTLRAAALRCDYHPSNVDTQTYIFLDDVPAQSADGEPPAGWPAGPVGGQVLDYGMDPDIVDDPAWGLQLEAALTSIPTMSLVTDVDHLFGTSTGIYVNASEDGVEWERPASLELIHADGSEGFQIDAGVRIRGGSTDQQTNPKHAFRLLFRKAYGAGELEYPLFGDEGTSSFDKIDLRTSRAYAWSVDPSGNHTLVRDVFSRDTQRDMQQPYTRSRYYHLYINGQYWGVYQTEERPEAAYGESYFGGARDDYDVIKVDPEAGYTIYATDGNLDAWQELWTLADAGLGTDAAYYRVQGLDPDGTQNPDYPVLLDVDNLIDYMLVIFSTGDKDAPISALRDNNDPNNFFAVRNRNGGEGFRFFAHDAEHTLSLGDVDRTGPFATGDAFAKSNPQWIHQQLMAHPEYRLRFADHAHRHLFNDGVLTPDVAGARFSVRADEIDMAIIAESARWGDAQRAAPFDKHDWEDAVNNELDNFFPDRSQTVVDQLRATTLLDGSPAPLYPDVEAPIYSQHGGQVDEDFILWISFPEGQSGTIYYTLDGSDPRLPGGDPSPEALVYNATPIPITDSIAVKARILEGGQWSALVEAAFYVGEPAGAGNLAIIEVNYNPHDPTSEELFVDPTFENNDFEFIELQNTGNVVIDLTGVEFTQGIDFDFAGSNLTRLGVGQYVVIAKNLAAFEARYGAAINPAGQYGGSLDSGGERLRLADRFGQPIHDFQYDDSDGWPSRADGRGSSLEVENTLGNYNDGGNWRPSTEYGGSPGSPGAGPVADVVLNEVLPQPMPPDVDAIELYNASGEPVDVGGWYLSDSSGNYRKFQIPRGPDAIIQPGEYLVFDASDFNASGGVDPNDFALDGDGDDVWLLEADAADDLIRFADHVEFGEALRGVSFGRWPNGSGPVVMMTEVTLGDENAAPRVGGIVINEIHSDPLIKTDLVEYIELYNAGDLTVDLSGWYFSAGVEYTFPAGAEMAPGDYLVVSMNPAEVQAKLGVSSLGPFLGRLDNEGELIRLRDAAGIIQDEVEYGLGFPWPVVGDPPGYSLELINPALDNSLPGSWRASSGSVTPPETLVYDHEQWRYFKGLSEPPATWRQIGFDDSGWLSGQTAIGYGEGFVVTQLSDMRYSYSTVYLRNEFTVGDPSAIVALELLVQYDDAVNVWINGQHVRGLNVSDPDADYDAVADGAIENTEYVSQVLGNPGAYLVPGTNVLAVQLLNSSLGGSSDAFFDATLRTSLGGSAGLTPGGPNSVLAANAPPQMHQVGHSPRQPVCGEDVAITLEVTDPDGVARVTLDYQIVEPGDYIKLNDPRYSAQWATVGMYDDGTHGDQYASDDVYTVVLPGSVQQNRRLVRYRVTAEDARGVAVTAPYPDDPQPNFAYYVYDGVPSWSGAARPGVEPVVEYSSQLLTSLPVYTLITNREDRLTAMTVPYRWGEADQESPDGSQDYYGGSDYKWEGTLVYDGVVYDHIRYRARGGVWRYSMGKNMWKFDFNKGHYFQAHDDYGNPYEVTWDKLNFSALIQQGNFGQRGEQGLFEWAGFKLHNLAGNAASNCNFLHFRLVDDADEGGPDQFSTDFQGLYMTIEQPDGRLLDQHGLPDGNFYKMEGGTGTLNNQGPTQPDDRSDLNAFMSTYQNGLDTAQWWEDNFNLEDYYSFRMIAIAIHDYDMHAGKNYFYYHNPETDQWSVHNWDIDLCWTTTYGGGGGRGPLNQYVLDINQYPQFVRDYNSRVRELRDLLFNPEQTGMLLDECAQLIYTPGQPSFADADCAMWDYNPILISSYINMSKADHGRFYGNAVRPPGGFAGMVEREKLYVQTRQYTNDPNVSYDEGQQPNTPTVTYVGQEGYPIDALEFESSAFSGGSGSFAAMEWRIAAITDPAGPDYDPFDRTTPRKYEITATWESDEITAFDSRITIPGEGLQVGETYRVRVRMKGDDGRWSHWSAPVQFQAGTPVGPLADGLRITELNYMPYPPTAGELAIDPNFEGEDFEFIELCNTTGRTLDLSGVKFTDGVEFDFTASSVTELEPGEYVVVVRNLAGFRARYGQAVNVAGQYDGKLRNEGERIELRDGFQRTIHDFTYDSSDEWPGWAEGKGASLEVLDPAGDYSQPANWRASARYGGSPGEAGDEPLNHVVVNEVLSHASLPDTDAIELHNRTGSPVDVGGWYLSDSSGHFQKFRIPDGTTIPADGYVVFDESDFNPTPDTPGPYDFAFNGARQGEVWLMKGDAAGKLTHFADHAEFGAAACGESWGRWPNGSGDLYPMLTLTLDKEDPDGGFNSGPRVGPVIISEVHYNPELLVEDDDLEFIEILNTSGEPVGLTNWLIRDGIHYDFPPDTILEAHAELVIVPFELSDVDRLAAFRSKYGIDESVELLGAYSLQLSDDGERVQLLRADEDPPDEPGFIARLLEDEVNYRDTGPWPADADGHGASLNRVLPDAWGNAPISWSADPPSPGRTTFFPDEAYVVGRYVFYNRSAFDGNDPGAGTSDDSAIAPDKEALLPGETATFVNYISYSRGINGIMIDVDGLPEGATPGIDDFRLRIGNTNDPAGWTAAPPPSSITLRPGQGTDGSGRITIIFNDNTIQKQWLQVTVLTTGNTGLAEEDVFYFGNAVGESGNSAIDAKVNAFDMLGARDNQRTFLSPAPIDFPYDFNRDARVNTYDMLIARDNQTHFLNALRLITVPAGKDPGKDPGKGTDKGTRPLGGSLEQTTTDGKAAAETPGATAHDAVLNETMGGESGRVETLSGKLAWLHEFEQFSFKRRGSGDSDTAKRSEHTLWAAYPDGP